MIRSTNSDVKSTLALSLAPARIVPNPRPPGSPSVGAPDSLDSRKVESPNWRNPLCRKSGQHNFSLEVLGTVRVRRRHQTVIGDIYRDQRTIRLTVLTLRVDREVARELGRSGVVDIDVEGVTEPPITTLSRDIPPSGEIKLPAVSKVNSPLSKNRGRYSGSSRKLCGSR